MLKKFLLVILLISISFGLYAYDYENDTTYPSSYILSEYYFNDTGFTIQDSLKYDGLFFEYDINSKFGEYNIKSKTLMDIRIHEIKVMDKFEDVRAGDEILSSMGNSLVNVGKGVGNAVVHPIKTIKSIPHGIGKFMNRIATFGKKNRNDDKKTLMQHLNTTEKRKLAVELGVDVYSSNDKIQEMLNQLANYRTVGSGSVTIGSLFIPGAAGIVYSVGSLNQDITTLLRDNNAIELEFLNNKSLEKIGIPEEKRVAFLKNQAFTPTHQTIIAEILKNLKGTKGKDVFIEYCITANDEVEALYYQKAAEMLLKLQDNGKELSEINPNSGFIGVVDSSNVLYLLMPVDLLTYNSGTEELIIDAKKFHNGEISVITTGKISDVFKSYLKDNMINYKENF